MDSTLGGRSENGSADFGRTCLLGLNVVHGSSVRYPIPTFDVPSPQAVRVSGMRHYLCVCGQVPARHQQDAKPAAHRPMETPRPRRSA